MTVAIMQPYIFPYLGYYQLVSAVNTFVFFDDVNYIKKGWINRNNILKQNHPLLFTVPLVKASQNRLINEIQIFDYPKWKRDFLRSIEINYRRAPQFSLIYLWLNEFLSKNYSLISDLSSKSVEAVLQLLELPTVFKNASSLKYKSGNIQNGEQKILSICKLLEADRYINPRNGFELYNNNSFTAENIKLNFICMNDIIYPQLTPDCFVPNLSIIDVLMFNDKKQVLKLLTKYKLV